MSSYICLKFLNGRVTESYQFCVNRILKIHGILNMPQDGDIPVKLIKMNEDIFSRLIFQNFNQSLINGDFPHCLKQAEVIPVFKKE